MKASGQCASDTPREVFHASGSPPSRESGKPREGFGRGRCHPVEDEEAVDAGAGDGIFGEGCPMKRSPTNQAVPPCRPARCAPHWMTRAWLARFFINRINGSGRRGVVEEDVHTIRGRLSRTAPVDLSRCEWLTTAVEPESRLHQAMLVVTHRAMPTTRSAGLFCQLADELGLRRRKPPRLPA